MKPFAKIILWTGALVGTLDGAAAIVSYLVSGGKTPAKIFQFIASGVFGKAAFAGGNAMVLWGIFSHFAIACAFTLFFFAIYPRVGLVRKNRIAAGLGYGLFVWMMMNLIVVPLSNTPKLPFRPTQAISGALILMVCVGLPIALSAHRFFAKR